MKTSLALNRETLRHLNEKELSRVGGGYHETRPCASYITFQSFFGNPPIPCQEFTDDCPVMTDFCG